MLTRREFVLATAGAAAAAPRMTSKERVERAVNGQDVDRPPFTFWNHFGLEKHPGERHAEATLAFHHRYRTDLVKVMSDYPFPKPAGRWYEVEVSANPFPEQVRALELIRKGLGGRAWFVETVFNPWNVATKLASKDEVLRMQRDDPKRLLAALEAIAESEANHAKKALQAGAAGIFLAIDNAQEGVLSRAEYARFSEPFDRAVLKGAAGAPLNVLHLHGDKVYLDLFWKGWPAAAVNYSAHATGVSIAEARRRYGGVILGGLDERNYRTLAPEQLRQQADAARQAAGKRFILTPGCSVPNESTPEELERLPRVLGA